MQMSGKRNEMPILEFHVSTSCYHVIKSVEILIPEIRCEGVAAELIQSYFVAVVNLNSIQ